MRTAAMTGDFISADLYSDTLEYYSHYRTLSKIAADEGKKLFIAEVPGVKPIAFKLVADVGGPSAGAMAWVGKEDLWGLIKADGTRRLENGQAWNTLFKTYTDDRERYATYRPGSIHVYFPEETLNYSVSDLNHIDAFNHICDSMMPEELELVLTPEIEQVPANARIYVLERTLPLEAIARLEKLGNRVISPHEFFVDENGARHPRKHTSPDFFATLQSYPEGAKLLDVFRRVEEKASNLSQLAEGATVSTQSELAAANDVLPDRPNKLTNLIDGSVYDGVTFADKEQDETVVIALQDSGPHERRVCRLLRGRRPAGATLEGPGSNDDLGLDGWDDLQAGRRPGREGRDIAKPRPLRPRGGHPHPLRLRTQYTKARPAAR